MRAPRALSLPFGGLPLVLYLCTTNFVRYCLEFSFTAQRRAVYFAALQLRGKGNQERGARGENLKGNGGMQVQHIWGSRGRSPFVARSAKSNINTKNRDTALAMPIWQHRAKPALRLGGTSTCIFSAILHRNSLLGVSPAASFLYNLTKNLTAYLHHQLCAVLP